MQKLQETEQGRTSILDGHDTVDVDQALVEEYRHLNPHRLPLGHQAGEHGNDGTAAAGATAGPLKFADCVQQIHALPAHQRPVALCLSGGGIRSATFSLGVLQSFARSQRLRSFDYLSTVSGGGYIGSWLTAWLRQERGDWTGIEDLLADGIAPVAAQRPRVRSNSLGSEDPVSRLRAYSNYLSPVWGLSFDALALVAIFLRNLLLNLCVWLPLLGALVLLPRLYVALLASPPSAEWAAPLLAGLAAGLVTLSIAYTVSDLPPPLEDEDGNRLSPSRPQTSHFSLFGFWPLLAAAMLLGVASAWHADLQSVPASTFALAGVIVHVLGIAIGLQVRRYRGVTPRLLASGHVGSLLVVFIGAVGGGMLWLASQNAMALGDREGTDPLLYAIAIVPALLGCYWLALSLYAGLMRRLTSEDDREWWSRATGTWLLASVGWIALFGLTVHLPLWLLDTFGAGFPGGVELGLGGTLLGIATAMAGYWSKNGATLKRRAATAVKATGLRLLDLMAGSVIVIVLLVLSLSASALLERCSQWQAPWRSIAGFSLCAVDLAARNEMHRQEALLVPLAAADKVSRATLQRPAEARVFEEVVLHAGIGGLAVAAAGLSAFAMVFSNFIGANTFSLHGMYGNRLVRAYLGAVRARRRPHWFTGLDLEDNLRVSDADAAGKPKPVVRPFHVVNIALNLVKPSGRRLAWQQRKAASFTVTPLRCGAEGLGYCDSRIYGSKRGMSLGRALTISGAAASPNMGYHSSPLVTFVMTLFNVRLGWWLPNPGPAGKDNWSHDEPAVAFRAVLDEARGATTDDTKSVYLSDGGHFDNLGLYEMVRRRCHRIVVIDASCDPTFQYGDLHDSVRKIRVDLGIPIDLEALLPGPDRKTEHTRLLVGRIRYSARDGISPDEDGWLYLMKPRLTGDEPLPHLAHYAAASSSNHAFPHQSTADQFFDETQFECYRQLGMYTAEQCFGEPHLWPVPAPPTSPAAYQQGMPLDGAGLVDRQDGDRIEPRLPTPPAVTSSLLEGLQQLGGGAALATALTVGGTLGVVGTVTLAPSEVRFAPEDRALLREGLSVQVAGNELRLSDEARRLLAAGLTVSTAASIDVAALNAAAGRLQAAADRLQPTGGGDVIVSNDLKIAVASLQAVLRQWSPPSGASGAQLQALTEQVALLVTTMKSPGMTVEFEPLIQSLAAVKTRLDQLDVSIKELSPRRSVRGQDGGTR